MTISHLTQAACDNDLIGRLGASMRFVKDEEIYGEGERADRVYRVVSGAVRTSRFMADGRRPVGDFYQAGDIFGLETASTHGMTAEALSDCVVLAARREAILAAGGKRALDELMWQAMVRELENTREHLELLVRKSAHERVASFLLGMARRSSSGAPVELAMGRQDMADYLGLTIETVSRMITQLQGAGVVRFEGCRRFRVCDHGALETMAVAA